VLPIGLLHDLEAGWRWRARQIINAAPTDLQKLCLLADR
jgi:hypothetical protein